MYCFDPNLALAISAMIGAPLLRFTIIPRFPGVRGVWRMRPLRLSSYLRALVVAGLGSLLGACQTPMINGSSATMAPISKDDKKRHEMNILSFSDKIAKDPDDPSAYNLRGSAYGEMGDFKRALNDFNKAIAVDPSYYQAFTNRAVVYFKLKKYQAAHQDFDKALALAPDYAGAYYGRALLYQAEKQPALAMADLNKTIELTPDNARAYFLRGEFYFNKGDMKLALADFNSTIDLSTRAPLAYYGRGKALMELGRYQSAFDDFKTAAEQDPKFYEAFYYGGLMAEKTNAPDEAAKAYRRALAIKPAYLPAQQGLKRVGNIKSSAG